MIGLTIAVCTSNRASQLEQVLISLCATTWPRHSDWEVLVVLNDCIDDSAEVAQQFVGRLPISITAENQRGISYARNHAVQQSRGDFIIFIDDDVRVDKSFLVAYETAIQKWPDADIFSGPIIPEFEGNPPFWLERALPAIGSAFALQTVEHDGQPMVQGELPYGANYAIKRSVQSQRFYNPEFGRGPVTWLRSGEETELLSAVVAGGSSGRWVASASVKHIIGTDRQTLDYLWGYYEGYGVLIGKNERKEYRRPFRTLSSLAEVAASELVYRLTRLFGNPEHWAAAMVRAAVRRGRWKSWHLA